MSFHSCCEPATCDGCGHELQSEDPSPVRRQIADIPKIQPYVEHRCHTLCCAACGARTCAEFPADLPAGAFGGGVKAMVAYLTAQCRLGKRLVATFMRAIFHIDISVGTVSAAW